MDYDCKGCEPGSCAGDFAIQPGERSAVWVARSGDGQHAILVFVLESTIGLDASAFCVAFGEQIEKSKLERAHTYIANAAVVGIFAQ